MDNSKRDARRKQEDIALTRALIWFAAAAVLEFLLLLVNKYFINFTADASSIAAAQVAEKLIMAACGLGILGAAACGVWTWRKWKAAGQIPFLPMVLTVTLLCMGIGAALILKSGSAVQLLYVLVPAGAVLALVYYLYQKEFFLSGVGVGAGLLGLWLLRKNSSAHALLVNLYLIAAALILLGVMLLTLKLKKGDGVLTLRGKQYAILPRQSNFLPVIMSCQASLLALIAGLLLGATAAFYLMFVLVAWLFVLLVYYTVKLM